MSEILPGTPLLFFENPEKRPNDPIAGIVTKVYSNTAGPFPRGSVICFDPGGTTLRHRDVPLLGPEDDASKLQHASQMFGRISGAGVALAAIADLERAVSGLQSKTDQLSEELADLSKHFAEYSKKTDAAIKKAGS